MGETTGNNGESYRKRWEEDNGKPEKAVDNVGNENDGNGKEIITTEEVMPVYKMEAPQVILRLNSVQNCRKSAAKLVRLYMKGDISAEQAKVTSYQLQTLIQIMKLENEMAVQEEIQEIKDLIMGMK